MLVSALAGREHILNAYQEAIREKISVLQFWRCNVYSLTNDVKDPRVTFRSHRDLLGYSNLFVLRKIFLLSCCRAPGSVRAHPFQRIQNNDQSNGNTTVSSILKSSFANTACGFFAGITRTSPALQICSTPSTVNRPTPSIT